MTKQPIMMNQGQVDRKALATTLYRALKMFSKAIDMIAADVKKYYIDRPYQVEDDESFNVFRG